MPRERETFVCTNGAGHVTECRAIDTAIDKQRSADVGGEYLPPDTCPHGNPVTVPRWAGGSTGPSNLAVLLTHCGQLIFRKKISKSDAARCQIIRL